MKVTVFCPWEKKILSEMELKTRKLQKAEKLSSDLSFKDGIFKDN